MGNAEAFQRIPRQRRDERLLGAGAILYSLLTDYELGVARVIPMTGHLWLDGLAGLLLAASPWLFGFAELVWVPHLVFGPLELGAALMTETAPARTPHPRMA